MYHNDHVSQDEIFNQTTEIDRHLNTCDKCSDSKTIRSDKMTNSTSLKVGICTFLFLDSSSLKLKVKKNHLVPHCSVLKTVIMSEIFQEKLH